MSKLPLSVWFPSGATGSVARPPVTTQLTTNGSRVFLENGRPWRYRGVSLFALVNRFIHSEDITDVLTGFEALDFNVARVFLYTPVDLWGSRAWPIPLLSQLVTFHRVMAARGWRVENVLITDRYRGDVRTYVQMVTEALASEPNALIELVNEPEARDKTPLSDLEGAESITHCPWTNGGVSGLHRGTYLTRHTDRGNEWPRKSKDLRECYDGKGPDDPSDPPHRMPCVADEPIRPDQARGVAPVTVLNDYLAFFAVASIMGAGATFHYEGGKFALPPDEFELSCAVQASRGLAAFPPEAPLSPYLGHGSAGDGTLRTYTVGPYVVRVRAEDGIILPRR